MRVRQRVGAWGLAICVCAGALVSDIAAQGRRSGAAATGTGARGSQGAQASQTFDNAPDDPLTGPVVTKAPFSADAVTTVTRVLGDGTRIEETTTARFSRDSAGRVRREQTILGLAALNTTGEPRTVITIDPDPGDEFVFTLDPMTRTARRVPRMVAQVSSWASPDGQAPVVAWFRNRNDVDSHLIASYAYTLGTGVGARLYTRSQEPSGVSQPEESLGTRQIEGVSATGRVRKSTIPTGQIGNDRPIEISTERWVSPDLRLVVRSLHRDPRNSDVEYRLTNISRAEPAADLFQVPADYTVVQPGTGGGRGARGQ